MRALPGAMGAPQGRGRMCGCTQRYYIKWYRDPCTHKWIKAHPHVLQILCPRGVGYSVTDCVVKPLCDVKVTGLKPARPKNPSMLRVGVAQAGCDPWVILMT
jgi:hypothetical protein